MPRGGLVFVAGLLVLVVSCAHDEQVVLHAALSEGGVQVDAALRPLEDETWALTLSFSPIDDGFHIYSVDHDPTGSRGLGIPTRVELGSGLEPLGRLSSNAPATNQLIAGLDTVVRIYEQSPVELTIRVRRVDTAAPDLRLTYGACSDEVCLPPVVDRLVRLEDES